MNQGWRPYVNRAQEVQKAQKPRLSEPQYIPPQENWDYKGAPTDRAGQPPPAGAQGFDPLGRPYFGPGLMGTLKRYAWQFLGEPQSGLGADNWKRIVDLSSQIENKPVYAQSDKSIQAGTELTKRATAGLFDASVEKVDEGEIDRLTDQINELAKAKGLTPQQFASDWEIANLIRKRTELQGQSFEAGANDATGFQINGQKMSLASPLLKAVKVGTTTLLDLLQEPAIKTEQLLGAERAMREFSDPEGAAEDQEAGKQAAEDLGNENLPAGERAAALFELAKRSQLGETLLNAVSPALRAYNAIRFFSAPGSAEQKAEAVKQGWDEGRLLYSEFVSPAIRDEYRRRAEAGEDPQLLAMELQNPWAELTGQLILDPLNFLGVVGKASKIEGAVDDAAKVVRASGLADDADFLNDINNLNKVTTPADGVRAVDNLANRVKSFFYEGDKLKTFNPQEYKIGSLNADGNRMMAVRNAGNVLTWGVGNIFKNGMQIDDVNDWLSALVKLSSPNLDEVKEGVVAMTHFPSPKTNFGQQFLETSVLLRNMLKNEDGVVDVQKLINRVKTGDQSWTALGNKLKGLLDEAAQNQYPTITEMQKAADAVKSNTLVGKKLPEKTLELAKQYEVVAKNNPGVVRMAALDEIASKPKNAINRFLGNLYFSYQYGVAFRNAIQNQLITLIDAGPRAWYRDGQFLSLKQIDDEILKWHGGQLPPAISGFKTLPGSLDATQQKIFGTLPSGTKIMEDFEISAAKRVYYKFFRDTMESVLQPGRALPSMDEFVKAGFTETQANRFIASIKENGGDVLKAAKEVTSSYTNGGPDVWRMWESYIPQNIQQSMREYGLLDEVIALTKNPEATREDIASTFQKWREELKTRAGSIVDDTPGKNPNTPLTKEVADIAEFSGKHLNTGDKAYLDTLLESSYQAVDKYIDALADIGKRTGDKDVLNLMADLAKREPDNQIRKVTKGVTDKARDVIARYRKGEDPAKLWAELGSPGNYSGDFVDAVWQYVKGERLPQLWGNYFDRIFSMSEELASRYGVTEIMQEARILVKEAQEYRTAEWRGLQAYTPSRTEDIYSVAAEYGVKKEAFRNTMKKYDPDFANRTGNNQYYKDPNEVRSIMDKLASEQPEKYYKRNAQRVPPPYVDGTAPTFARAWAEGSKGFNEVLDFVENKMLGSWGLKAAEDFDALKFAELTKDVANKTAEAQLIAQKVGEYWRDFALLPYGQTTHLDHALSYIYPYQFWYSRSYANWMKRLASDPQVIAAYAKFKDQMAQLHKDSPEWWKYNVTLPEFMWGLNNGNPMFLNLEATVWPLYGLTGTDFNDPRKRTNWFTSTVDDLGKFGPSVWAPINMAIAAGLTMQGEEEAASRWGSRLIPQTATFKALQAQLGYTPTELDPAVMLFSGQKPFDTKALDPYEESRALRALAEMQKEGLITDEQAIELAYTQQGPLWDEAVERATRLRAPGQLASFFLGVGFKARTEQDMQMDSFYQDYYRMKNLHDSGYISDEQYEQGFNELREQYPFMDTVLLGRRAGDDRDAAYAYNVIARIPPGMTSEIYDIVGIDPKTANKFYESGGDMSGWNEQERDAFMTAMVNAGAIISIPDNATRTEWTEAKNQYSQVNDAVKTRYGEDIDKMIDDYFSYKDKDEAQMYGQRNPKVMEALDYQNYLIQNNPLLLKYYGGIDTLERYYTGLMYDKLEDDYGRETLDAARMYSTTINKEDRDQILKQHPELQDYWDDRAEMSADNLRKIAELGKHLEEPELQTYGEPQNPTQEDIQEFAQPQQQFTVQEWNQMLGPSLMALIDDFANGQDFEYSTEKMLDSYADRLGYENRDDLVRDVLVAQ